jgi:hypothetical protein
MAITLWTDTFVTLANANNSRYLADNENWNQKTDAEKEILLKNATKRLNWQLYQGSRESTTQALEWPRNISQRDPWPSYWFEDAYMENILGEATSAQVAWDIAPLNVNDLSGQEVSRVDKICEVARDLLKAYMLIRSPVQFDNWSDEERSPLS